MVPAAARYFLIIVCPISALRAEIGHAQQENPQSSPPPCSAPRPLASGLTFAIALQSHRMFAHGLAASRAQRRYSTPRSLVCLVTPDRSPRELWRRSTRVEVSARRHCRGRSDPSQICIYTISIVYLGKATNIKLCYNMYIQELKRLCHDSSKLELYREEANHGPGTHTHR